MIPPFVLLRYVPVALSDMGIHKPSHALLNRLQFGGDLVTFSVGTAQLPSELV